MPIDLRLDATDVALFADLYEFTVSAVLFEHRMNEAATFELAMRRLGPNRGYMVAAGIERALEVLEDFHIDEASIAHLESLKLFKSDFLQFLANLHFTGSVRALREGTIFFGGEPVMQVTAPIIEAQLVETLLLNQVAFASVVATKAARCHVAANGRRLIDFGPRRAQGADAPMITARSSYLAGFDGTASVAAGRRYGIPVYGTMSHSFVMAHDKELKAFEDFVETFPRMGTLLVDTYDNMAGVQNAVKVGLKLREAGLKLSGVRLDSGDLRDLAFKSRRVLDHAELNDVAIFASGNLDEYKIEELVAARAPIDAFGIGTALAVSDDAPAADFNYKLVEYRGTPRMKLSAGKISTPGRKQIFRAINSEHMYGSDLVGLIDESRATVTREFRQTPASVDMLLEKQMESGQRVQPRPTLEQLREHTLADLQHLDVRLKALRKTPEYPVKLTAALNAMVISEKMRADRRQE